MSNLTKKPDLIFFILFGINIFSFFMICFISPTERLIMSLLTPWCIFLIFNVFFLHSACGFVEEKRKRHKVWLFIAYLYVALFIVCTIALLELSKSFGQ